MQAQRPRFLRFFVPTRWAFCFAGVLGWCAPEMAAAAVEFNRDIRPIFSKHCTACHGGVKAAGGISFVYREKALAKGKSDEFAIIPGKPEESELIRRVISDDPDDVMPKPDHGPKLGGGEIALLRQWIQEGAQWSELWSFVPPVEPPVPRVKQKGWAALRADELVLARIEAEGLAPAPEAGPAEWLRRVFLDLNGLPPSPEDFEEFSRALAKDPAGARAVVVDRLLGSARFGERWAALWLDLSRYSDTFGYEKDPHRDVWPWRDWVIRSLNEGLPFNEFVVRQIAGDLLPEPTTEDLLATAFHRNTQNNTEGGTDDEEFRTAAVLDRVNTTWTALQATTFGCVQCHSHPYDPIPHRDYYRFAALFDNAEDNDLNDDFPKMPFPDAPEKRVRVAGLYREKRELRNRMNDAGRLLAGEVRDWKPLLPVGMEATGGSLSLKEGGRLEANGTLPKNVKYTLSVPAPTGITALRLEIFPDGSDPKQWPERNAVLSHLEARILRAGAEPQPVALKAVYADYLAGPFDPQKTLEKDGDGFGGYPVLTGPRWCVVVLEAPLGAEGEATFELGMTHSAASNSGTQVAALRKFAWATSADPRWTALLKDPACTEVQRRFQEVSKQLADLGGTQVPVIVERSQEARRDTRVFRRGNRLNREESVEPGLPEVFRPPQGEEKLTRLGYARWLFSENNTLTARVLANRLWAELFGHGIVETLEDFGTSGATPNNPPLLDHLALRLSGEHRWMLKPFLRELVLSATYRQSARAGAALAERDPQNLLLARGPRVRLTAEMVRDQALAVSGLLSSKMYGPPVYPPQPEGIWSSVYSGQAWKTSEGEDRFRRAVYTYSKRTSGYPGLLAFDAPTRDACAARRIPTNTPLQALLTLNDPAFLEMAQALSKHLAGSTPRERITAGCRRITLEPPPIGMVHTLTQLYEDALGEFQKHPEESLKLAPRPEEAALVLVANTLLNLDRAMVR
jgi:hypothetical protein